MAVRKIQRLNKATGKAEKSKSWYIYFHDHHRREHSFSAGTDLDTARRLERQIKTLVGCRKKGYYPPEMLDWIDDLPQALRAKLAKWDLLDGGRVAAGVPISEHLADWRAHLLSSGVSSKQADLNHSRAERVFSEAAFHYLPDMVASKTLNTIDGLAKLVKSKDPKTGKMHLVETDKGVSSMTKKHHLRAVKQFSKWLKTDGRMSSNPLESLAVKNAVVENKRRSLTQAEIVYLLDYTANAGTLRGLSGRERSLIYRVAIETGLRASELASLTRTSFDFDGLSVKIQAGDSKNRKAAVLPVKAATMARIKDHLSGKMPTAAAFGLNPAHGARMIQDDLTTARQQWTEEAKNDPTEYRRRVESDFLKIKTDKGKIDFHSLRHSFATFLVENGADIKTAQSLLRHSTPAMTLGIYSHSRDENLTAAVDNLPDFEQRQVAVKTGTDDFSVDAIAENRGDITTPKNTPNQPAKHGKNRHKSAQLRGQNQTCWNNVKCNETPISRHSTEQAAVGFEPTNNGFANRRLRPLGYAAKPQK